MAIRDVDGAFTRDQVIEELKKQGVTTLDGLAQKVAEESAAKAQWTKARGLRPGDEVAYLWSGPNYSLHHFESQQQEHQ
jgi:hypothetical protein